MIYRMYWDGAERRRQRGDSYVQVYQKVGKPEIYLILYIPVKTSCMVHIWNMTR